MLLFMITKEKRAYRVFSFVIMEFRVGGGAALGGFAEGYVAAARGGRDRVR